MTLHNRSLESGGTNRHASDQTEINAPPLSLAVWAIPPEDRVLPPNEVHVWRVCLDGTPGFSVLADMLSPSERHKAMRFRFSRDRDCYVVTRGILRYLLGCYLRQDPCSLQLTVNEFGKPFLVTERSSDAIHFNVSHSHELALLAFVREREIGVDLEYVRSQLDVLALAQQFFAPGEVAELHRLDPTLRTAGFFNCWTRKESYIKARGLGLSLPLDRFQVSLRPGSPVALLCLDDDSDETLRWCLRELAPGSDYVGALAVEGQDWQLKTWQWASNNSVAAPAENCNMYDPQT